MSVLPPDSAALTLPDDGAALRSRTAASAPGRIEWRRSIVWLLLLGPFFFLSYGFSNSQAAQRAVTDALFYDWERQIPFLPWTIVPYWSIDLLYGLSFLFCRGKLGVDRHALRLLGAQLIAVACFLHFPLRFAFERPPTEGVFGAMFDALTGFDKPYNQAPSLHIALLVIIWVRFALGTQGAWRWAVHLWAVLIGVSVLTTWQHHFIDVPTGALVGLLCVWLWPDDKPLPLAGWRFTRLALRWRLAGCYLSAAAFAAGIGFAVGGGALWLLWPAVALTLVALIYIGPGARGWQKENGRHGAALSVLFAPYLLVAWLNSRWWTRRRPAPDEICDGVWLGRLPSAADMRAHGFGALCDLTAELPAPRGPWRYAGLPWLDLVAPEGAQLVAAANRIDGLRSEGPLLVCCALGYSRSACAVAAWLLLSHRVAEVEGAIAAVRSRRPDIVLGPVHRAALATCLALAPKTSAHG